MNNIVSPSVISRLDRYYEKYPYDSKDNTNISLHDESDHYPAMMRIREKSPVSPTYTMSQSQKIPPNQMTQNILKIGLGTTAILGLNHFFSSPKQPQILDNPSAMLTGSILTICSLNALLTYGILRAGNFLKPDRDLLSLISST